MPKNYRKLLDGVYRSASLYNLSQKDIDTIKSDGIRCIIDLRTGQEIEEKPDTVIPGTEYIRIPLFPESAIGITRETGTDPGRIIRETKDRQTLRSLIPDVNAIYRSMIEKDGTREAIIRVVRLVRSNMERGIPTLFHCTVGKDRTGIVSAILLLLEGYGMDSVMKDYLSTRRHVWTEAVSKYILVLLFKQDPVAARMVYDGFTVKPEYLTSSMDAIQRIYGSTEAFLDTIRNK